MNTECHGHFFKHAGSRYYRCLWDGRTCEVTRKHATCPLCNRACEPEHGGRYLDGPEGRFMPEVRDPLLSSNPTSTGAKVLAASARRTAKEAGARARVVRDGEVSMDGDVLRAEVSLEMVLERFDACLSRLRQEKPTRARPRAVVLAEADIVYDLDARVTDVLRDLRLYKKARGLT